MSYKTIIVAIILFGCTLPPKEKVLEVDSKGRVLKTFDGQLLRKYDTLGNLIEFYGNVNYDDWQGCVHNKMFFNQENKEIRRILYQFNKVDTICKIVDSLDYLEYRNYYSKKGFLIKCETYEPVKKGGKVVGYRLSYTTNYSGN